MIIYEPFNEDDRRHEPFWDIFRDVGIYPNRNSEAFMVAKNTSELPMPPYFGLVGVCCITAQNDHLTFDVAVLPQFRSQGIGSRLAQEAIDYLLDLPFSTDAWQVKVVNSRLYNLMSRNGFIYSKTAGNRYYYREKEQK